MVSGIFNIFNLITIIHLLPGFTVMGRMLTLTETKTRMKYIYISKFYFKVTYSALMLHLCEGYLHTRMHCTHTLLFMIK